MHRQTQKALAMDPSTNSPKHAMPDATPYSDVNAALGYFLEHAQAILRERFRGMYLDGSLVLGDFDPQRSDIDFVVVTDADLPDDVFAALQAMHDRFMAGDSPWAVEIEASYIPQDALRRHHPTRARHPRIERGGGRLVMEEHAADWIVHRYVLREHGVALAGPHPRTLIDPVGPHDLRRAMVDLMRVWWAPMGPDSAHLRYRGYQTYAVLTMCRMLYTLETSRVISKPAAARWARQALDSQWTSLIDRARAGWQKGDPPAAAERGVRETAALIRYTADQCEAADRSEAHAVTEQTEGTHP
jgi:hypothetical protein